MIKATPKKKKCKKAKWLSEKALQIAEKRKDTKGKRENERMILVHFQGKPFSITESKSMPQPLTLKKLKLNGSMKTYQTF